MIKKAYDQSKQFVFVFAVFSMIFYTVSSTALGNAVDDISQITVILEKVSNIEKKQDDCVEKATICSHDITVLQGFHK